MVLEIGRYLLFSNQIQSTFLTSQRVNSTESFEWLEGENKMKFSDLKFKFKSTGSGVQAKTRFDNGLGVSVVKSMYSYGGSKGLYELAVLDSDGDICYDTPITNDVIGHLSENEVTELLERIENLEEV